MKEKKHTAAKKIPGTILQKRVFKRLVENRGRSVSAAMRAEGYSEATAKNPKNFTDSKAFAQLAEEFLPDRMLLKVHKEGLSALRGKKKPDYMIRHKYLETGYKIKGRMKESVSLIPLSPADDRQKYAV